MGKNQDTKAFVTGTFDTKSLELNYITECLKQAGVDVVRVDLGTSNDNLSSPESSPAQCEVSAHEVAGYHPKGADFVAGHSDRGDAIAAMTVAFEHYLSQQTSVAGVIGAGGSGGTALLAPAFRSLPVGVPKMIVSTVASGNVAPYVGGSDITMMYSVTDVQGLNGISRQILGNAANALAGMIINTGNLHSIASAAGNTTNAELPAIGLTMFGVTTPCVTALTTELKSDYECLVFHATGTGGMSMEKLCDSGRLAAVLDLTTTEIADLLSGGVFAATEDRMGAVIRTGVPYVGSVGALDMVNFGAKATVPDHYKDRLLHVHNPQVTLMRTTPEENVAIGKWLANKINSMTGEVRFLLPLKGVSMLDADGQAFFDPEADQALFDTLESNVVQTDKIKLVRVDANINDAEFVTAALDAFAEIKSG